MLTHTVNGIKLNFKTNDKVFSPLNIDRGTLAMLSVIDFSFKDKLLDLGCGYGFVGIYAATFIPAQNIVMSDIDNNCIELSKANAKLNNVEDVQIILSNGFENIQDKDFTLILSNPPYHVDFSLPKHFIEKGFNRLQIGGKMYMVTKRKDWYKNKLTAIFGGVRLSEIDGYFVFCAEKRSDRYANK
jgi:16S rRNA (guanine1207-N2)-methyltransferase